MPARRSSRAPSVKPPSKAETKPAEKPLAVPDTIEEPILEGSIPEEPPASLDTGAESQVNGNNKRPSSPEQEAPPPAKRAKAAPKSKKELEEPSRRPPSRVAKQSAPKPASKAAATKPSSKAARALKATTTNGRTTRKDASEDAKVAPAAQVKEKPAVKEKPPPPPQKPYFLPLPSVPEHQRPGLLLFAWGAGNFGQFGMGPDILHEIPKPKRSAWVEEGIEDGKFGEEGAGLESIAAGGLHTLLVDEKGTLWSCGVNDDAALGRETQNVPDPENPGQLLSIDDLTSYPHPLQSLIDEKFRVVKSSAGDSISAAVSSEGELRVWGSFRGNEGALGFSSAMKNQVKPVPPPSLPLRNVPGDAEKVVSVASGSNHLLVLTTHGNVFAWGASEQGQLGHKIAERRKITGTIPSKVMLGSRANKAVAIGAGAYHSFAVDENGDVWGWGLNTMGQTGTGYDKFEDSVYFAHRVINLSRDELGGDVVVEIAGGAHHTLFRTQAGKVYAVGRCDAGQLGLSDEDPAFKGRSNPDFIHEPTLVTFPDMHDPIVQISCGAQNNAAVTEGGALYSWGQGLQGELGVAEDEIRTPRVIVRKEGGSWHAVAVSCGGQHTLGLFRKK